MIDFEILKKDLGDEVAAASTSDEHQESQRVALESEPLSMFDEEEADAPEKNPLPPIVDAATFSAEPIPEPDMLIKGLVHKGTKIVVGGGSKSFKTWVQLDAAVCVAYGQSWLGYDCVPGKVLFVNLEIQAAFFQARLKKIIEARGIQQCASRLDVWNLRGFSAPYQQIIPKIIERIKESQYSLVILDPIYKLYGDTDENSAGEVGQMLNALEQVCVKTGAAVLFGAHYSKGNQAAKESIDRISGSGVFARDPDTILPFTRHEEEGSFVVEPILRNLPPQEPFVVTWNHPLMEQDTTLDPQSLKQSGGKPAKYTEDDVLKHIDLNGVKINDLQQACSDLGMSRATYFRLKKSLVDSGRIWYNRPNDRWYRK